MTGFKFPDEMENEATQEVDEQRIEAAADDASDWPEVEVVDDTPEKDRGRKPLDREVSDPTDDEMQAYSEGVKKRIKELTHARHDERRKAEALAREKAELERIARGMLEENNRLKQYVSSGEQEYAKVVTANAETELEAARRKLKEAHESFDTDAIVAAQEALADAKMRVERAKSFKPASQAAQEVVQTHQQVPERAQTDEKTLRWQAKNQWFSQPGYEDVTAYALGLHQKLVNSGVDPRSDEYFEQIDARLHTTFPDMFGEKVKATADSGSKRPATVVAPAARSSGPKKVQLTQTQVALAKKFGLTPQQYAMELAKLEKQNG